MDEIKLNRKDASITWGYALPWYAPFMKFDDDPDLAKLKFLVQYGFTNTNFHLNQVLVMPEKKLDILGQYIHDHDLNISFHVGFDYIHADKAAIETFNESTIKELSKLISVFRSEITHCGAEAGHRFDDGLPVVEKMERLSMGLSPLASECAKAGVHLCIENHADFYVSDYVKLIKETPDLYLFLDTGNTYFLGEKPMPAFVEGAPYTIGTHLKDHKVRPVYDARPIHFEVDGCALGCGHVPLKECFALLIQNRPMPDKLIMQFEMIVSVQEPDPIAALEKSIVFINEL